MTEPRKRTDEAQDRELEAQSIDPNDYIGEERQQELIGLADAGNGASAVRLAIRETVVAFRRQMHMH